MADPPTSEGQRPDESAAEYATRLLAQLRDSRRREADERLQKEKAQQREADERSRRLQADLEVQRAVEAERHIARLNALLQEELRQQRHQSSPQALPAYLAQISRLQTHAVRLLPHQPPAPGSIPPHVQRSSASSAGAASLSSSPQPTTTGRTDITNKYYPLHLRRWTDFRANVQHGGFARIYAALQQSTHHGLPSRDWVQTDETTLLESLPLLALNQEGGLNAARTHDFLKTVLFTPASRILNEYFNHSRGAADQKIFFDTAVQSIATALQSVSDSGPVGNFDSLCGASDVDNVEDTENAIENSIDNLPTQGSSKKKLPKKVLPDCLVYHMDSAAAAAHPVRLIASAEHKPLHAIRAESVSKLIEGPLPEDLVIRLARKALARREKKKKQSTERGRAPTLALPAEPRRRLPSNATSKTQKLDKLTYFTYALTQAYHYMFMAGLQFGFLATGEVLVFLRIPEEDATTLLYHASLFPVPGPAVEDNGGDGNDAQRFQAVTQTPYPAPGDPVSEEALAELPIAQMASFCEYAMHAERRSPAWIVEQAVKLAQFPELPPGVAAQYDQRPSSHLGRRHDDDDDADTDSDGDGDGHNGGGGGPSKRQQFSYPDNRVETESSLQQHMPFRQSPGPADIVDAVDISTAFLSTRCDLQARPRPSHKVQPPTLPYCTHACLLGLVQSRPLDPQCPNYPLHQAAGQQTKKEEADEKNNCHSRHPVTSLQLAQRIRDQLFDTPEVDCEYSVSHRGAVGYPFKLTLTGLGYTFVGKAVQTEYGRRLVRESKIYKALLPLQGSIIPVHLGLIRLHVGYPIPNAFIQLPFMMLLSYAGESMVRSLVEEDEESGHNEEQKDIPHDVARDREEAARTKRELESWGLDDDDDNASNFRWCREAGRAMRIDFDRAHLAPVQGRSDVLRISTNAHGINASQARSSQTASSRDTPTTPKWDEEEADFPRGEEPLAKRRKVDEKGCRGN